MKRNKNFTRIILVIVLITFSLTGCADLKDKFVRKKKKRTGPVHYYAVKKYDVHPSLELYTKRYIFWKNWHRELLMVMDSENHKKRMVSIDQEISNLLDMQNMLVDEKAEEMQKYVDELMEIQHKLQTQRLTQGNETRIRHQLGTIGRQVKKKFSYRKIGGYIADDFRYQHDFLGDAVEEGEEIEMVDVLGPSEDAKGVEEMIVHEEPFVNEPEETPREEALDEEINEDEETLAESETALDEGKE